MKRLLILSILITAFASATEAQTREVNLMIDHSIDSINYEKNLEFTLWNDRSAYFDYLLYYIHDVRMITSSGDTIGNIGDHYLVDAEDTAYSIGNWAADSVTKVLFNWGVALNVNHADPSQYPSTHPLAPHYPTMHWGWTAGYRFIRADGMFDDNNDGSPNLIFQYHMVGDQFVKSVEVDAVSWINNDDELEVWITGYYERLFDDINLSLYPSIHGSNTPIPSLWNNITTRPVFDVFDGRIAAPVDTTDTSTGINPVEHINALSIYPNPSVEGYIKVSLENSRNTDVQFDLVDLSGRIQESVLSSSKQYVEFDGLAAGFYIVKATDDSGNVLGISKVQVQ